MWGEILSIVGAGLGIYSSVSAASAAEDQGAAQAAQYQATAAQNAALSEYDATIAEQQAAAVEAKMFRDLNLQGRKVRAVLSAARAAYGKSGAVIGDGTPLTVMRETAAAGARDTEAIHYNGVTAAERQRQLAARYRMMADMGIADAASAAMYATSVATDRAQGYMLSGAANLATNLYQIWENWGQ